MANEKNDMETMEFKPRTIQLYKEDLEKLRQLPEEERADFIVKLRQEGRYTIIDD